jgi:SAM-dependent methyltransferase
MKFYKDYVVPRLPEWFLNTRWFNKERRKTLASARGRGLEVGFGTGLNLPHFPAGITSLVAIEPSEIAFRLAAGRVQRVEFPVTKLCTTCEEATLPAGDFDFAVTTCALCTIRDPRIALRKVREALRPDGRYLFLEHGRSASCLVAHVQDFWTPVHHCLCGGCHVNRPIDKLIEGAGFRIVSLERFNPFGLGVFYSMYRGIATPVSAAADEPAAGTTAGVAPVQAETATAPKENVGEPAAQPAAIMRAEETEEATIFDGVQT